MSNLVLSNLTINGRPVGLFEEEHNTVVINGVTYRTTTIGTQTWLAEGLRYDDGQGNIIIHNSVMANGVDIGPLYYYNYVSANRVANSIQGWHLPSVTEWETMFNYIGGQSTAGVKLKSTSSAWRSGGYPGTDDYGFSFMPTGYCQGGDPQFPGNGGSLWTSTQTGSSYYKYQFEYNTKDASKRTDGSGVYNTMRLVKDS